MSEQLNPSLLAALAELPSEQAAIALAQLQALEPTETPQVAVTPYGPYLVTGQPAMTTWLGEQVDVRQVMALCRCGESSVKPDCDGACVRTGFSGDKSPDRVPDRRDTYPGQQVTVLDNRGICQHSGLCTDRLKTVFRQGQDPFVAPSGGRMDEITRAVRDCPSGALSYAVDDVEARPQVDHNDRREPSIEISHDGPYRIVGGIPLVDQEGVAVPRAEGCVARALCALPVRALAEQAVLQRHALVRGLQDPVADPEHVPTMFEWAGGVPALVRMTRLFYEKYVPHDDLLAPIFATMSPDHPERVAAWLGEVFGGPAAYSGQYGGYTRMISEHLGRCLTEEWRARWVSLLTLAAGDAGLPEDPEFRSAFVSYLEWGSRLAVENSQTTSRPPQNMPMPHWDWGTAGPPGSRISALAPPPAEETTVTLPTAGAPISFAEHIKPLFRESDRRSMKFAFDLWSLADVSEHAEGIFARLSNGSMPCDGAWPADHVAAFRQWIDAGMPN